MADKKSSGETSSIMNLMQAKTQIQKRMIREPILNILEWQTEEHMLMNVDYNGGVLPRPEVQSVYKLTGTASMKYYLANIWPRF